MANVEIPKAYAGSDPFIFVSYSHRDNDRVMPFIMALQKYYNVWFDDGIHYGNEWALDIANHINDCYIFLYMVSKNSLDSNNCKDEITMARDLDKNFINILLDSKVELPRDFQLRFNRYQMCMLDSFRTHDKAIKDIVRRCNWFEMVRRRDDVETSGDGGEAQNETTVGLPYSRDGEFVFFGRYPQGAKVKGAQRAETIVWRVVKEDEGALTLCSEYLLESMAFGSKGCSYADSNVRQWLIKDFLNGAFNDAEKAILLPVRESDAGGDTVSLMSVGEASEYFAEDKDRAKLGTDHAKAAGMYVSPTNGCSVWWLCDGGNGDTIGVVDTDGNIDGYRHVSCDVYGVAPTIMIRS